MKADVKKFTRRSGENSIRLILESDDFGFCHASNSAHINAFRKGVLTVAELLVPSPWFDEAAEWCRTNPQFDVGIHLTLTCEWKPFRWKPILPYDQVSSLVDEDGHFYPTTTQLLAANPSLEEAEKELRAQTKYALKQGVLPSHLSTHMGAAQSTLNFRKLLNRISKEFSLPLDYDLMIDLKIKPLWDLLGDLDNVPARELEGVFTSTLKKLEPGTYINIFHICMDTPEFQALSYADPSIYSYYGRWAYIDRPKLYEIYTSHNVNKLVDEVGIKLTSYRELVGRSIINKTDEK
jgi:predicted glycoside hydrolase/deacetylase ChbG (UPF0249 family)